MNADGAARVQT